MLPAWGLKCMQYQKQMHNFLPLTMHQIHSTHMCTHGLSLAHAYAHTLQRTCLYQYRITNKDSQGRDSQINSHTQLISMGRPYTQLFIGKIYKYTMNIIKSGPVLSVTIKLPVLLWLPQTTTEKFEVLTGAIVMAPSIQVFVPVALLCCVITTCMGGITDWQKAFSQLENKVKAQQEEINSLHQMMEMLEKRLETIEGKGESDEVQVQSADPTLHSQAYSPVDY